MDISSRMHQNFYVYICIICFTFIRRTQSHRIIWNFSYGFKLIMFQDKLKKKIQNKLLHELNEIMIMAIKLSIGFGNTQKKSAYLFIHQYIYMNVPITKKTTGPRTISLTSETVPINICMCAKLCSYNDIDQERKKTLSLYWELNGPYLLDVEFPSCTQRCFVASLVEIGQIVL